MWLLNSVRNLQVRNSRDGVVAAGGAEDVRRRACTNVLTPDTIPEFEIPTTELPCRLLSDDSPQNDSRMAPSASTHSAADLDRRTDVFRTSSTESLLTVSVSRQNSRESDGGGSYSTPPRSPVRTRSRRPGVWVRPDCTEASPAKTDDPDDVNSDPISRVAMTLQHLGRKTTSYGFTTLETSPTTNRKESIYFGRTSPRVVTPESGSDDGWRLPSNKRPSNASSRASNSPQSGRSGVSGSSTESSPVSSPRPARHRKWSCDSEHTYRRRGSKRSPKYVRRQRPSTRRRSSLTVPQIDYFSSGSSPSSAEPSPNVQRKVSPQPRERSVSLQVPTFTYLRRDSREKETGLPRHYLGELKFSVEFVKRGRQLKVSIIKAENLGGHKHARNNINSYIRLYLLPGKVGRQQTRTVKHTRNPIFNEEFYFGGLGLQMLNDMKLRMKVFSKTPHLRRDELLGEVQVVLGTLDLSHENRLWRNLEPKTDSEDLGMLSLSLCYQTRADNMMVTVVKAENLPRNALTGAPDSYVKIVMRGPDGAEDDTRHTKIQRKTCDPVFKEAFSFSFPSDLFADYSLVVTVYDHARILADGVIGQVRLGAMATEESELQHVRRAVRHRGKPINVWHDLMEAE
ncbi:synaptotagmin-11-like [Branchiostoma lanceolatum]|uniref:synaptotagmin-11-like n=1 Tax=Branchiostoma lanceolatum TaxID=7740 RepID=UPI0034565D6F